MAIVDERGVILSWMSRLLMVIGTLGVLTFDAGAIAVNFFGLDSTANDIANSISSTDTGNEAFIQRRLEQEAKQLAREADAKLVDVTYDRVNQTVSVRLKREANTILIGRIGPLEDWTRATADAQARTK